MDGYYQGGQHFNTPTANDEFQLSPSPQGSHSSVFTFVLGSEKGHHDIHHFRAVNTEGSLLMMATVHEGKYV